MPSPNANILANEPAHRDRPAARYDALCPVWQLLAVAALIACTTAGTLRAEEEERAQLYRSHIGPLLESRCIACHGPDEQEGGLRLDSRAAALKGGEKGPAIVPGKPKESLLLAAVLHETKELAMPPKERLADADIAALRRWIDEGAVWPAADAAKPTPTSSSSGPLAPGERIGNAWSDPRNPIVRIFRGERLDLWSLRPIVSRPLPQVADTAWAQTSVDPFVLAQIESRGLRPTAEADRRTLARRLYYDLTGLPPTYEQVEAFVADEAPDAYERLVDELLASPRYGEHIARMWLDVVRYSDSNGFDWDEFRPRAWLFRDYVIRSFNADKPFDQFVAEQLAGDELVAGPPRTVAEQDALIATGYLRIGPQDNSSSLFNEQARSRAEWMADLTETTASAFMGLTYSCCRCHDHKYDPLSQVDHFRLRAFFEPLRYGDDLTIDLAGEQEAIEQHNRELDAKIQPLQAERDKLREQVKGRIAAENDKPNDKQIAKAFTDEEKKRDKELADQIAALNGQRRKPATGLLATDAGSEEATTHLLYQGDHKQPRDVVDAGFVSILDPNPATFTAPINSATKGRRLTLARWIASSENPLTARVLVNRLWQLHFGRGIVATPNDFGFAGDRPTHPELLDHLAEQLIRSGWSIKAEQRQIVLSATYRQASTRTPALDEADPENRLYARQTLRRLSAEQLRDSLLAAAGLLTSKSSGPPIWPELPPEVLQANPAFLDDNAERTKGWYPSPAAEQGCRSIFLVQKRTVKIPLLETFDLPENQVSCGRRENSTVAPQALTLLNSPLATQAAQAAAESLKESAGEDKEAIIQAAFRQILRRDPAPDEVAACARLLEHRTPAELCRALLNVNEFVMVD